MNTTEKLATAKKALFDGERLKLKQILSDWDEKTPEVMWLKANSLIDDSADYSDSQGSIPPEEINLDGKHLSERLAILTEISKSGSFLYAQLALNILKHESAFEEANRRKGLGNWMNVHLESIQRFLNLLLIMLIMLFIIMFIYLFLQLSGG